MRQGSVVFAVIVAAVPSCTQELLCSEGAEEIKGICECPPGTLSAPPLNRCVQIDPLSATDAGGGAAGDATSDAAVDAGTNISLPASDASPSSVPCENGTWIRCGNTCVDPELSPHCGGCNNTCELGSVCTRQACQQEVGCSDGTREAFTDMATFPTIAGCAALWPRKSMRAPRERSSCGNSGGACLAPVDACALGWHVCGNAVAGPKDITGRVSEQACSRQKGRFAGALGDHECEECLVGNGNGSVCCGDTCTLQGGDCLWKDRTAWFSAPPAPMDPEINSCGSTLNQLIVNDTGVMCCKDES